MKPTAGFTFNQVNGAPCVAPPARWFQALNTVPAFCFLVNRVHQAPPPCHARILSDVVLHSACAALDRSTVGVNGVSQFACFTQTSLAVTRLVAWGRERND